MLPQANGLGATTAAGIPEEIRLEALNLAADAASAFNMPLSADDAEDAAGNAEAARTIAQGKLTEMRAYVAAVGQAKAAADDAEAANDVAGMIPGDARGEIRHGVINNYNPPVKSTFDALNNPRNTVENHKNTADMRLMEARQATSVSAAQTKAGEARAAADATQDALDTLRNLADIAIAVANVYDYVVDASRLLQDIRNAVPVDTDADEAANAAHRELVIRLAGQVRNATTVAAAQHVVGLAQAQVDLARAAAIEAGVISADALPSDLVPPVEPGFEQAQEPSDGVEDALEEGSLSVAGDDGTGETIDLAGTTGNTVALEGSAEGTGDQFGLVVRVEEEGLPFSDNHITLSGGAGDDIFDVSITGVEDGGNNSLVLDGGEGADTFNLDMDNLENAITFRYDSVLDGGDTITGLTIGDEFQMEFVGEDFAEADDTNFQAGGTNDESGLEQTVLWFYNADTATLQYDADGFNNGNEAETIATFKNADGEVHNVDLTAEQLTFNENADTGMG